MRCQEWSGIYFYERLLSTRPKPHVTGCPFGPVGMSLYVTYLVLPRAMTAGFSMARNCARFRGLLLTLVLLVTPRPASADFQCNDDGWQGTSGLLTIARAVAGPERVKLVAELDYGRLTAQDSVLFLHPEVELDADSLNAFFMQGGRIAVLDDFGKAVSFTELHDILRVPAPTNPQEVLRSNHNLSVGTPVETQATDGSWQKITHPLVRDVDRVMLNHPTGLANLQLTRVLEIRSLKGPAVTVALTAVSKSDQKGRLLVMSDPSAFINLMIRYPGNLAFARAMIHYLTEDDDRSGKGLLYIVANRFDQTGRFSRNKGPLADAVDGIDHLVRELKNGLPPPLLLFLTVVLALAIARWIARHAWRRPSLTMPRALRRQPLESQAGWPGRAAVLVAPTTQSTLLLLELRDAFRARLAQLISSDAGASSEALIARVEAKGLLPAELLRSLKELFAEVDAAERAFAARRPFRVRSSNLTRVLRQSLDIVEFISHRERETK